MNMLGLDMNDNIKGRTASVRIVANFGSQILHLPRFLTPLAISRKFHASPLRGVLCTLDMEFKICLSHPVYSKPALPGQKKCLNSVLLLHNPNMKTPSED